MSIELGMWLVQQINGTHEPCYPVCNPTANIKDALSLLEIYMTEHQDRFTHVEFAYDSTCDEPWIVYLCTGAQGEVFKSGYPLHKVICEALKEAIERTGE